MGIVAFREGERSRGQRRCDQQWCLPAKQAAKRIPAGVGASMGWEGGIKAYGHSVTHSRRQAGA